MLLIIAVLAVSTVVLAVWVWLHYDDGPGDCLAAVQANQVAMNRLATAGQRAEGVRIAEGASVVNAPANLKIVPEDADKVLRPNLSKLAQTTKRPVRQLPRANDKAVKLIRIDSGVRRTSEL